MVNGIPSSPTDKNGAMPSPMIAPPGRPRVRRAPGSGAPIFFGDYAQQGEPHQKHWEIERPNVVMTPQQAVVTPPVEIPTETLISNQHLAQAISWALSCTMLQTKNPNWMEPPSESLMIDQSTDSSGIPILAAGNWVEVLNLVVPDRWYMIISHFGNMLEDDAAFLNVDWRIMINDRPMPFQQYMGGGIVIGGLFTAQLGNPANPTRFAMPLIAKYTDIIHVHARSTNGVAHTAYARMMGWTYPVSNLDSRGDACNPTGMVPMWGSAVPGGGIGGGTT